MDPKPPPPASRSALPRDLVEDARCRRRKLVTAFLLLPSMASIVGIAPDVGATRLAQDDFAIELAAQGGSTCVMIPERLTDGSACNGIDVERVRRATAQTNPIGVAALRFPGMNFTVLINRTLIAHVGEMSDEEVLTFLDSITRATRDSLGTTVRVRGDGPSGRVEATTLSGMPALHVTFEADLPANDPKSGSGYLDDYFLFQRDGYITVQFIGRLDRAREIGEHATGIMKSVVGPRVDLPDFGKSRSRVLAYSIVRLIASIGVIVGFLGFLLYASIRARRARLAASRGTEAADDSPPAV